MLRRWRRPFIERGINIVSNGTENHLMLVSLIGKEYTGTDADRAMGEAFITVNKNAVPNDPRSPFVTSGLTGRYASDYNSWLWYRRNCSTDSLDVRYSR